MKVERMVVYVDVLDSIVRWYNLLQSTLWWQEQELKKVDEDERENENVDGGEGEAEDWQHGRS